MTRYGRKGIRRRLVARKGARFSKKALQVSQAPSGENNGNLSGGCLSTAIDEGGNNVISKEGSDINSGHFLASPSTGVLRGRSDLSDVSCNDLEDEFPVNNSMVLGEASFFERSGSELFASTPVKKTVRETNKQLPTPASTSGSSVMFTVADMTCVSGLVPTGNVSSSSVRQEPSKRDEQQSVSSSTPRMSTAEDASLPFFKRVEAEITCQLPVMWEAKGTEDVLILRKNSFADFTGAVQRGANISRDGTVRLNIHNVPIRLDHIIWQELPDRVSLDTQSLPAFVKYALQVVNKFREYDVCIGSPEEQYFHAAKKMQNVSLDTNVFQETRYSCTYRSDVCDYILQVNRKRCDGCKLMRSALQQRLRRQSTEESPHPKTNNKFLNTPQTKHKLKKLGKHKKNVERSLKYYKEKIKRLIERDGVTVDQRLRNDLKEILIGSSEKLTNLQKIFLQEQLKASKVKGKTGMRWHPVMIRLALKLHTISPAAYDALYGTGVIRLPSERTLFDYSHHSVVSEGISRTAVREILKDIKDFEPEHHKRYFILLMDEMSISSNLVYSRATGELKGFVDISDVQKEAEALDREMGNLDKVLGPGWDKGRPEAERRKEQNEEVDDFGDVVPDISKKMLSYMAIGVTNGIKQVVASFGVTNVPDYSLSEMTWNVIAKLEMNDAHVLGLVCDGHPVNRKFIQSHEPITKLPSGIVFDTWNRVFPRRPFYFFSDPPHLLKTIRNCFYNSDWGKCSRVLKRECEFISWRNSIVRLFEGERCNEIRMAHKLNAQVVYLNSYSGMKVSYAARVFSRTVSNALRTLYPDLGVTADFILIVNNFFDCLNGASVLHGKHTRNNFLKPYRSVRDFRFDYLEAFLVYLEDWREVEGARDEKHCLSVQTLAGIEMTVKSFIACTKFMLLKGAPFILARTFCQDPLEQFFSKQRASCGGSDNPNKARFLQTQNKLLNIKTLNLKRSRAHANTKCVDDPDFEAKMCASLLKRKRSDHVKTRVNAAKKLLQANAARRSLNNSQRCG